MSFDSLQLETSGKSEKIKKDEATGHLENIQDVKKYLAKLSEQNKTNKMVNPEIQKQVTTFLEKSANNALPKNLEKFNAQKFDTNGENGLDQYEFRQFTETMKWAIEQIIILDGIGAFEQTHNESREKWSWNNPDKWIAERADLSKHIFWEKWVPNFTEDSLKKLWDISPEEFHKMSEKPFSFSRESGKELSLLLAKEVWSGVEDLLKFLTNIPAGLVLLPRYLSYRMDVNSSDIQKKTEWEIKLAELVWGNSSLALVELLGEKWILMIKELGNMIKSGKQWDIVKILVTIAGIIAGWAGAIKLGSNLARKSAIKWAREAGYAGRTAEWRAFRNGLRDVSDTAGKVAEVANKVDNIVSGNTILGKSIKTASSGIKKVAPAMGFAANDAGNIVHLNQMSEIHNGAIEEQATGTYGPSRGSNRTSSNPTETVHLSDTPISPDIAKNIDSAYANTGINPLEVQKNAWLKGIEKNEAVTTKLWRTLSQTEFDAMEHIHNNISKWIYSNSTTDLMKMAREWEKSTGNAMSDPIKFQEFRILVENGFLWHPSEAAEMIISEATIAIIQNIDNRKFLDTLSGKKINQAELNALVYEYSEAQWLKPKDLDIYFKDVFEIAWYEWDQATMYANAISYTKRAKIDSLIANIKNIPATKVISMLWSEWIETSGKLLEAFLKWWSTKEKTAFLKLLGENTSLRETIMRSPQAKNLLETIWENAKDASDLLRNIINNDKLLTALSPEVLIQLQKTLETLIDQSIFQGQHSESLRKNLMSSLKWKIVLTEDGTLANQITDVDNKTNNIEQNKHTISREFEDLRSQEWWWTKRLEMIKKYNPDYFREIDLDTFFNMSFRDLERIVQLDFLKKYVIPETSKYHSILERFPGFRQELLDNGLLQ